MNINKITYANTNFGYKMTNDFKKMLLQQEGKEVAEEKIKRYSKMGNDNFVMDYDRSFFYSIPKYWGNKCGTYSPYALKFPEQEELSLVGNSTIQSLVKNNQDNVDNLKKDFPHISDKIEQIEKIFSNELEKIHQKVSTVRRKFVTVEEPVLVRMEDDDPCSAEYRMVKKKVEVTTYPDIPKTEKEARELAAYNTIAQLCKNNK